VNKIYALFIAIFLGAVFAPCQCKIIYVDQSGHGDCSTIQEGINAVVEGDTVLVAPGLYEERVKLRNGVYLKSLSGPGETIITDNYEYINVLWTDTSLDSFTVIDGFTVEGGRNEALGLYYDLDGVDVSCKVINNIIKGDSYHHTGITCGDGYSDFDATPIIVNNLIYKNRYGGILALECCPIIIGNTIVYNTGTGVKLGGWISNATIKDNVICYNKEERFNGGGMVIHEPICESVFSYVVENNIIAFNSAKKEGGGIAARRARCIIRNNLIVGNVSYGGDPDYGLGGGGICNVDADSTIIINNTIVGNYARKGAGINDYATNFTLDRVDPIIKNNIIAFNHLGEGVGLYESEWIPRNYWPRLSYNLFWQNEKGPYHEDIEKGIGDLYLNPFFVDKTHYDFYLSAVSPCIDTGDPTCEVPSGGGHRIDIGAYEYCYPEEEKIGIKILSSPIFVQKGSSGIIEVLLTNEFEERVTFDLITDILIQDIREYWKDSSISLDPTEELLLEIPYQVDNKICPDDECGVYNVLFKTREGNKLLNTNGFLCGMISKKVEEDVWK
jgi:hypothetical protein